METEKKTKIGAKTIKGAIIEIIISALIICAMLVVVWAVHNSASKGGDPDIVKLLLVCAFVSVVFLLDGIISIPYIIKKRKKEKEQEKQEGQEEQEKQGD